MNNRRINTHSLLKIIIKKTIFYIEFNGTGKILFTHNGIISQNIGLCRRNKFIMKLVHNILSPYKKHFEILKIDVIYHNKHIDKQLVDDNHNLKLSQNITIINKISSDLNHLLDHLRSQDYFHIHTSLLSNLKRDKLSNENNSNNGSSTNSTNNTSNTNSTNNTNNAANDSSGFLPNFVKVNLILVVKYYNYNNIFVVYFTDVGNNICGLHSYNYL